jgi:hypothetical protein
LTSIPSAFDQTVKALDAAVEKMKLTATEGGLLSLTKFELGDFDEQHCTQLFRESANELSACFKEIGVR